MSGVVESIYIHYKICTTSATRVIQSIQDLRTSSPKSLVDPFEIEPREGFRACVGVRPSSGGDGHRTCGSGGRRRRGRRRTGARRRGRRPGGGGGERAGAGADVRITATRRHGQGQGEADEQQSAGSHGRRLARSAQPPEARDCNLWTTTRGQRTPFLPQTGIGTQNVPALSRLGGGRGSSWPGLSTRRP